jgi:hypothetical protein
MATHAEHDELMQFIENHSLMGKGLGYIDMHLFASAILAEPEIGVASTLLTGRCRLDIKVL